MEPLSPFISWTPEDRAPIAEELLTPPPRPTLAGDLLRSPRVVIQRVNEAADLQPIILRAIGWIAAGAAIFAALTSVHHPLMQVVRVMAIVVAGSLAAVAATLGPVYGASLLASARLPFARLVVILLAAAAMGTVLLAACSPLLHVLWLQRSFRSGPVGTGAAFLLGGIAAGQRIFGFLEAQAALTSGGCLSREDAARVGIVARLALVLLAFNTILVVRAVDLFSK
jgi:hypothetical protein